MPNAYCQEINHFPDRERRTMEDPKLYKDFECVHCRKFYNCKGKPIKNNPCLNIVVSKDGTYEKPKGDSENGK